MTCRVPGERLSRYLDGDLGAAETSELKHHADACEHCRMRLDAYRAVTRSVALLPARAEPPGAVRARLDAARFGFERSGRARITRARVATLVAVALACMAVLLGLRQVRRTDAAARDLVQDHLRSVPSVLPAQISSNDHGTVAGFFEHRVPFKPIAPVLPGATLLGGRVCRIRGQLTQLLFYAFRDQVLSLYVANESLGVSGCAGSSEHEVCSTRESGRTLTLVGQLPADEMSRLLADARP